LAKSDRLLGDLTQWYRALFGGRVLPPPQFSEMTSLVSIKRGLPIPEVTAADPEGFSLGLQLIYGPGPPDGPVWDYLGETLGSRALIAYWPQYDLVITMCANSSSGAANNQLGSTGLASVFRGAEGYRGDSGESMTVKRPR
jgi:D-alanyl-D-alanine carboxypeptidase